MLFLFNDWKITYAFSYREDNKKLNKTSLFSYDKGGNIIERIEYVYSTLPVDKLTGGTTFNYDYPVSGWKDQLISYDGESFEYDSIGNPSTYRDKTLTWKYGRQLATFEDNSYNYNADGIRISKTYNNVTTHFYLDGTKILAQDNGNLLTFKYGVDGVIGFTYAGVGEYFYKKNIFGDIIGIIDSNGQEIAKYVYDAWGNHKTYVLNNSQYVDISENLSYTNDGSNNKFIAELNPFRYRGYYYDIETGLYYLNSRYYDPEIGRFINADDITILQESMNFINGLNLYSYCNNNPIMNCDKNGDAWWDWLICTIVTVVAVVATVAITIATGGVATTMLIGAGIGALIGGTTSVVSQVSSGQGFNWRQLILDIGFGAITGLVGGSALGSLGSALAIGATSFAQSMATDLITSGSVNYGKAIVLGSIGAILGAKVGAQNGLTQQTNSLKTSLNKITNKIASGGYSLRGGKGALNLINYKLRNATGILKFQSLGNLFFSTITSNTAQEEIFKFLINLAF